MIEMAGVLHHHVRVRDRDGEQPYALAVAKALLTVLLVTLVVAAAVGGVTYVVSRALVGLLT